MNMKIWSDLLFSTFELHGGSEDMEYREHWDSLVVIVDTYEYKWLQLNKEHGAIQCNLLCNDCTSSGNDCEDYASQTLK